MFIGGQGEKVSNKYKDSITASWLKKFNDPLGLFILSKAQHKCSLQELNGILYLKAEISKYFMENPTRLREFNETVFLKAQSSQNFQLNIFLNARNGWENLNEQLLKNST